MSLYNVAQTAKQAPRRERGQALVWGSCSIKQLQIHQGRHMLRSEGLPALDTGTDSSSFAKARQEAFTSSSSDPKDIASLKAFCMMC